MGVEAIGTFCLTQRDHAAQAELAKIPTFYVVYARERKTSIQNAELVARSFLHRSATARSRRSTPGFRSGFAVRARDLHRPLNDRQGEHALWAAISLSGRDSDARLAVRCHSSAAATWAPGRAAPLRPGDGRHGGSRWSGAETASNL